jgi:hypothetical protein
MMKQGTDPSYLLRRSAREQPDVLRKWRAATTAPAHVHDDNNNVMIKAVQGNSLAYTLDRLHRDAVADHEHETALLKLELKEPHRPVAEEGTKLVPLSKGGTDLWVQKV